ncbi:MAG TPA: ROK family protein [Candidatus Limnocylindria bacterium]|nr:ROK family protein [Candidatus Limnocylindria bacterium]
MKRVLAVDIGGTKVACAVVAADGSLSAERRMPTPRTDDPETLFAAVAAVARASLDASGASIDAVGVGCGGPMRWPEGVVSPLHIAAWREFPLRERLSTDFGAPCVVDNDAKAFAFGEHWLGAGRGARSLLGIVVSTGVGAGIVIDGRLVHGAGGQAGHVGHVLADSSADAETCACGATGCVETIASGTALARRGAADAAVLAERARAGEAIAVELFVAAGRALARGIASAAALFDLDRVVVGGGVGLGAWDLLAPSLRAELAARARLSFTRGLEVRRAALGEDANLIGAAKRVLSDRDRDADRAR